MKNTKVTLAPLAPDDREQFLLDNQRAFKYGALLEFGERDDHIDDDGEIISRETIEHCIDDLKSETYRIVAGGKNVGGVILKIDQETHHNELEILFTLPDEHSKGIGYSAWQAVEALHPETIIWETRTPYFEKSNIHFRVNTDSRSISSGASILIQDMKCRRRSTMIPMKVPMKCSVS